MKKLLFSILYITMFCLFNRATAQTNKPNGLDAPPGYAGSVTLPLPYDVSSAPAFYNYIQTWTPLRPLTDTSVSTFQLVSHNTIPVATSYLNGFGQTLMSIAHGNSATHWKDIIQAADVIPSLTHNSFLPYAIPQNSQFQMNPLNDELNYYVGLRPNEEQTAYSQTVNPDDQSTINTVSYAPGKSFVGQGRGVTTTLTFNDVTENIVKYFVNVNDALDGYGTYYNSSDLTIKTTTGQHGQIIKTYINRNGQLICKKQYAGVDKHGAAIWQTTCYAYDLVGRLRYILPPLVSAANPTAATISNYASLYYTYKYDKYGNLIESDIPGKNGATYNVYDAKLRPVLVQTPLLRAQGQWQFAIYDSRSRVVITGLLTDANTFATWQSWANGSVTPPGGVVTGSLLYYILNGFTGTYPSSISNCDIRTINYYDTYAWGSPITSTTFGVVTSNGFKTDPTAIVPVPYMFTHGMLTARKVKINAPSGSFPNQWITDVYFYDQKGELIQTQTLNPWNTSTWDTTTFQYDFAGHKVFDITHHFAWSGCDKTNTTVENQYFYDFYGRISGILQRLDGANWRDIASASYDELGNMNNLTLGGVEKQDLTYNIRGQLESINADYLYDPTIPDKTFGCYLNYDFGFDSSRYDGGLSGIQWRGAGTGAPMRAYGYKYDPAGRLNYADFNETPTGSSWNKTSNDFSMSNVTYDLNGNILTMNQRGTSTSGPVNMDILSYTYSPNSNQLQAVRDGVTTNYGLGDFHDSSLTTDYTYDNDGNLSSDFNKAITSITYNELDQPTHIQFPFGSISNTYDAAGALIQRKIVDSSAGAPHTDVYKYWAGFTYRNDSLLYLDHSAGRARWLPDSSIFKYDFYVTDHQGNVRSVVTSDESSPITYFATHEIASAGLESSIFANMDSVRDLKPGSTNPYDLEAAHLDGSDAQRRIGTALLMSVMAGDKFDISATSYYDSNSTGMTTYADGYTMLNAITGSLVNGVGGYAGEGTNTNMVGSLFTSANYLGAYMPVLDNIADPNIPRAFINYLVFDQGMNLVPEQSGAIQVSGTPGSWQVIGTSKPVSIGQNGYVAIYMSDEQYLPVYMDQLHITYYRGRLIQEQHYYPFGLPINPVTSSGSLPIKNQFEGNQTNKELGLNQADFNFRQYDYQIGKFTSIDPLAGAYNQEALSPYHFVGNNPANFVDPMGLGKENPPPGKTAGIPTIDVDDFTGADPSGTYMLLLNENGLPFIAPGDANIEIVDNNSGSQAGSSDNANSNYSGTLDASVVSYLEGPSSGTAGDGSSAGGSGGAGGDHGGDGSSATTQHHRYAPIDHHYYDLFSFRDFYNKFSNIPAYSYKDETGKIISFKDAYNFTYNLKPWKKHAEVVANLILLPGNIVTVGNEWRTDHNMTTVDARNLKSEPGKTGDIHLHVGPGNTSIDWRWRGKTLFHGIDGIILRDGPSPADRLGIGNNWNVMVDPTAIYIYNEYESHRFEQ